MKKDSPLKLGFDIQFEKGSFKPSKFKFWNSPQNFEKFKPTAPLKYMSDALVGLSFVKLNSFAKSPIFVPHMNYDFVHQAWKHLEPHSELFKRSQERVKTLAPKSQASAEWVAKFEKSFTESFEACQKPWGIDFAEFETLLNSIAWLESKISSPLLFNFELSFSPAFMEKLHSFYAFLFHMRSLVAVDYNAHVEDPTHESVKVDSIADYFPKAEYVVNDAILYYHFKKLSHPWQNRLRGNVNGDHPVDKLFVEPLEKTFHKYMHNACALIDQLPESFLGSLNPVELEEALYLVQMDWLLGSPAGLLFRIREEIYGITHGYESIFWHDANTDSFHPASALSISVELSDKAWNKKKAA